ncbi:hypothetical protein DASC09_030830 [Saccharomycopsis crataegensis]|uniref:LisH domain-containing protein n=1 Tax=Saccharomycopsis crataegensis TaxID=43959 RepID=A0AAV5QNM0_9ASCO|nr:hypothetical protein DASC09_030830 [Saccharomycopsis crataegensis]
MVAKTPIEVLIADFLKSKGYTKTLTTFQNEAGITLPSTDGYFESLQEIVDDRQKYLEHSTQVSQGLKNLAIDDHELLSLIKPWQYTNVAHHAPLSFSGASLGLDLTIIDDLKIGGDSAPSKQCLLVSGNDKILRIVDITDYSTLAISDPIDSGSIFKSFVAIPGTSYVMSGAMDGLVYFFKVSDDDHKSPKKLQLIKKHKIHRRVILKINYLPIDDHSGYLASIGFDSSLNVIKLSIDHGSIEIKDISRIYTLSNPTDLYCFNYKASFTKSPIPLFLISRTDSTLLSFFTLDSHGLKIVEVSRVSLNDAEFSSYQFTPVNLSVYNPSSDAHTIDQQSIDEDVTKTPLISIATSHQPYLRIITTKFPNLQVELESIRNNSDGDDGDDAVVVSDNCNQELVGKTLRGMIISNVVTTVAQDKYSKHVIHWKTNGSGVWIAGDDGIIRGVNFSKNDYTEVAQLKSHDGEFGARIICLAGTTKGGKEILFSSSSDKQIFVWQ